MTSVSRSRKSSFSSTHNGPKKNSGYEFDAGLVHSRKRAFPKRKVVFVDPDEPTAPYWWPAMIVPEREIEAFKQTMENDIQEPKKGEHLVCYFEDGSFSIVPETEAVSFSPVLPPYTDYLRGANADAFLKDKAVMLATLYWETGIVPPTFTWVRDEERYTNASVLPLTELGTTPEQLLTLQSNLTGTISTKSFEIKEEAFESSLSFLPSEVTLEKPVPKPTREPVPTDHHRDKKEKPTPRKKSRSPISTPKNPKPSKSKSGSVSAMKITKHWNASIQTSSNTPNTPSTNSSSLTSYSNVSSPFTGSPSFDSFTAGSCSHCGEYAATRITKVLCTKCSDSLGCSWCSERSYVRRQHEDGESEQRCKLVSLRIHHACNIIPRGRKQRLLQHLQSGLVPYI
ncbi:hypothetical protein K493DRAFT_314372 [Basidiobolus meristosporus CBS 931.73]|uniref:Uncharacterized protein n=1 Tax=Basidiobolus meristosporus CBS 931.73 TaxID=1314790 RepID=A0A1Y1YG69_9FUNG|nr:hypothetical protein K493DRAFT_314372 [Basidiobolus meristosporus CBS 931.73]|eukprot:ORX96736.1 hypothetical protein K493DRAFT_314372 [Basidiobolus meristosporus CBS 931.73]